jgi:hypothetical protein
MENHRKEELGWNWQPNLFFWAAHARSLAQSNGHASSVGRKPRRICSPHLFALHPHAPGLSHPSVGPVMKFRTPRILIRALGSISSSHPMQQKGGIKNRFKLKWAGESGRMAQTRRKGMQSERRNEQMRRGFRPAIIRPAGTSGFKSSLSVLEGSVPRD